MPWLFDWPILADPDLNKTFDVALHIGTLAGAIVYFRHDLWRFVRAWVDSVKTRRIGTVDQRLAWALVIGTIPGVIAGAAFYKGADLTSTGIPPGMAGPFVAGIVSSAVSGFLIIAFLLRYLRGHGFAVFMWYRLAVAAMVLGVAAGGIRPATIS